MARPKTVPQVQAFLRIVKVAERLQSEAMAFMKSYELSAPQYNVLRILRGAGDEVLSCHEISERMVTRVPDITRLLDRLEQKGLVERHRSPEDRRVVEVRISAAGLALLAPIDTPLRDLHIAQFSGLGAGELRRLDELLAKIEQPGGTATVRRSATRPQ